MILPVIACKICDKIFTQKSNLNTHQKIHLGEKNFKCSFPYCNKKFYTKGNLKTHLNLHLNNRQFTCDICSKSYIVEYQLKVHKLTHNNEKAHSCPICEKKFHLKGNFKNHLKIHQRTKSYRSNIKLNSSNTKKNISSHRSENAEFLRSYIESIRSNVSSCKINGLTTSTKDNVNNDIIKNENVNGTISNSFLIKETDAIANVNAKMAMEKHTSSSDASSVQIIKSFDNPLVERKYSMINYSFTIKGASK